MITRDWMMMMARYNAWQNQAVYGAADKLDDERRREDLGAFFKSIHGTLSHILWADQMWLSRFGVCPPARTADIKESSQFIADWRELSRQRVRFDALIIEWATSSDPQSANGDLSWYSGAAKREMTRPRSVLLTHIFNHQTHHRGQVHAMLTRLGVDPGVTDLPFQPD